MNFFIYGGRRSGKTTKMLEILRLIKLPVVIHHPTSNLKETLQEFQNLPNCESYKLEGFSQSYLDTIVYIQTNLKNITIPNAKVSDESAPKSPGKSSVDSCNVSNKIHDGDVSVVIKKIEVMKAVYDMNQDQEEKMEVY